MLSSVILCQWCYLDQYAKCRYGEYPGAYTWLVTTYFSNLILSSGQYYKHFTILINNSNDCMIEYLYYKTINYDAS